MRAKVFSKSDCPWCVKAKELLVAKGYEVEEVNLDDQNKRALFRRNMSRAGYGVPSTVPQIFVDDTYVGGYEDLERFMGC